MKGIFEKAANDDVGILLTGAIGNFTVSWGPALEYYGHLLKSLRWVRFARELKMYSRNIHVGRRKLLQLIGKQEFSFLNHDDDYQFHELINSNFANKMTTFATLKKFVLESDGS